MEKLIFALCFLILGLECYSLPFSSIGLVGDKGEKQTAKMFVLHPRDDNMENLFSKERFRRHSFKDKMLTFPEEEFYVPSHGFDNNYEVENGNSGESSIKIHLDNGHFEKDQNDDDDIKQSELWLNEIAKPAFEFPTDFYNRGSQPKHSKKADVLKNDWRKFYYY